MLRRAPCRARVAPSRPTIVARRLSTAAAAATTAHSESRSWTPSLEGATTQLRTSALKKGGATQGRAMYLDMQATTPVDPRVLDAMMPLMTEQYYSFYLLSSSSLAFSNL